MESIIYNMEMPVIASIVIVVNLMLEKAFKNKNYERFAPLVAGTLGGIIGVLMFYIEPQIIETDSVFYALMLGLFSGFGVIGGKEMIANFGKSKSKDMQTKIVTTPKIIEDIDNGNKESEILKSKIKNANELVLENKKQKQTENKEGQEN